ncbi:MAG: hypothetical protein H7336_04615 [Bacteriovorax sp.]|nr:hypothetical protein [Bacteriovorax sp.]
MGIKKDIDPRTFKESYNMLKRPNGLWFKSTKTGLHDATIETLIDFEKMPLFKKLTEVLDELDQEINKKGGRIFITENLVSKIKKGSKSPVLVEDNQNASGPYRKLCDEMIESGLEKDRYRAEETYMLTKSPSGEWSMTISHENHSGEKIILSLIKFPLLKSFAEKINKVDLQFHFNGGRVFITPKRVYRLKNKIEVELKI